MKTIALEVIAREGTGKGMAHELRRKGLIPAVIYGGKGSRKLAIRLKDLQDVIKAQAGSHALLEVDVDGEKRTALLKDVQYDPIRRVPIHADIFEVAMDKKIRVTVEVKQVGAPPEGIKTGGILMHSQTEVEIECYPMEIPESIPVDLAALKVGDSFHVSDLPAIGVKILSPRDQVLFTVVAPTVEAVPEKVAVAPEAAAEGAPAPEGAEPASAEGEQKAEPKPKAKTKEKE